MSSSTLHDEEFGDIVIKRVANTRHIRLRIAGPGRLSATMPRIAPLYLLKRLIESSRHELRTSLADALQTAPTRYDNGDRIGASHRVLLYSGKRPEAKVKGLNIMWSVPTGDDPQTADNQDIVRSAVRRALDNEAKAYLPRRLAYLAEQYGFGYSQVRYSNAKGRWGSCNSRGVISLNVALMNLPMELVDYVLVHELSHTKHLNHSPEFWAEVGRCYPHYAAARKKVKTFSPYL